MTIFFTQQSLASYSEYPPPTVAADAAEIMFYFLRSDSNDTTAHLQMEQPWVMFAPSKQ